MKGKENSLGDGSMSMMSMTQSNMTLSDGDLVGGADSISLSGKYTPQKQDFDRNRTKKK